MLRMIAVVVVVFAVFVFVFLMAALTLDLADDPDYLKQHPPDGPSLSLRDISPRGTLSGAAAPAPPEGEPGVRSDDDDRR